jgi:DsbC/DsbD-like thiol-disulfide interchange protein
MDKIYQKFYQRLTMEQKRKVRKNVEEIAKNRKEQIKLFEAGLMQPLRNTIKAGEDVKKNLISLEQYVRINEAAQKQMYGFFAKGTVTYGNKKQKVQRRKNG